MEGGGGRIWNEYWNLRIADMADYKLYMAIDVWHIGNLYAFTLRFNTLYKLEAKTKNLNGGISEYGELLHCTCKIEDNTSN